MVLCFLFLGVRHGISYPVSKRFKMAPSRGCAYCSPDEQDGHHLRLHGYAERPHIHHRLGHLDYRFRQLHRHDHRGSADLICVDHCFTSIGYGSDHVGSGSGHTSAIFSHADNLSFASSLQRETDRQHRPARLHRSGRHQAC